MATLIDYYVFLDVGRDYPIVLEPYSFSLSLNNSSAYSGYDTNLKLFKQQAPEALQVGGDPWR